MAYWGNRFADIRRTTIILYGIGGGTLLVVSALVLNHSAGLSELAARSVAAVGLAVGVFVLAGATPAALGLLADMTEAYPHDRGAIMGLYSVFLAVGQILGLAHRRRGGRALGVRRHPVGHAAADGRRGGAAVAAAPIRGVARHHRRRGDERRGGGGSMNNGAEAVGGPGGPEGAEGRDAGAGAAGAPAGIAAARTWGHFIDGEWHPSMAGATFDSHDPADARRRVGTFALGGAADVAAAIRAAETAFPGWRATPAPRRGRISCTPSGRCLPSTRSASRRP